MWFLQRGLHCRVQRIEKALIDALGGTVSYKKDRWVSKTGVFLIVVAVATTATATPSKTETAASVL